jgi:hypothetical protein
VNTIKKSSAIFSSYACKRLAMLFDELMNKSPGDLILEFQDGNSLKAHKIFLSVASTVFNGALADAEDKTSLMKVIL